MAANCCERVYNLGCRTCTKTVIELPFNAPSTGMYTAVFEYLGQSIRFEQLQTEGDPMTFGVSGLNEEFTFLFHVLDTEGDEMGFVDGAVTYDCFSISFTAAVIGAPYTPPDDCEECPECPECPDPEPCPLRIDVNSIPVRTVANACSEPVVALMVKDQNGDYIPFVLEEDGTTLTINIPEAAMEYVAMVYNTEENATFDTTTIPDAKQVIRVLNTQRDYPGDNTSTSAELIAKKVFIPWLTEDTTIGLQTKFNGNTVAIQTNDLP